MPTPKISLSETEVSQEIDFDSLTGAPVSLDPALQREMAQATIDFIKKRVVEDNKGLGGKPLLSPYSKSYEDSLDFEAAGKSSGDVNMTLSGDMLGSIDVLDEGDTVKIGIDDPDVAPRAYGHQSGFEGHPNKAMKKYKREFFGVTDFELEKEILPQFQAQIEKLKKDMRPTDEDLELAGLQNKLFKTVSDLDLEDLFEF